MRVFPTVRKLRPYINDRVGKGAMGARILAAAVREHLAANGPAEKTQ